MSSRERNYYIDLLKFSLAVIVALGHFGVELILNAGFAVSMFFMISGYFVARHADLSPESVVSYTHKRINKVYPEYVISFTTLMILTIVVNLIRKRLEIAELPRYLINLIPEALLIQGFGFAKESINPTMWFMSVLMVASSFIYLILKKVKKTVQFYIIPIFCVISFMIIGNQENPWILIAGVLYLPLYRGLVTMLVGVLIYYVEPYFAHLITGHIKLFVLMGSTVACILIGNTNNLYLFFSAIILLCVFSLDKYDVPLKYQKILSNCGIISEKIYYWHYLFVVVLTPILGKMNIRSNVICSGIYLTSLLIFVVGVLYLQRNVLKRANFKVMR